jgi:hypothetical protein
MDFLILRTEIGQKTDLGVDFSGKSPTGPLPTGFFGHLPEVLTVPLPPTDFFGHQLPYNLTFNLPS